MSAAGWGQLIALIVADRGHRPVARAVHGARVRRRRRRGSTGSSGRSSGSSTGRAGSTPSASSAGTSTRCRCSRSAWSASCCCIVIQRIQHGLPFNPTDMVNVAPALSFNTAVSFVTNTNWQSYGGENTLSHLTQMMGLTVQNFVSAAAGMAVMVALIRGLSRAGQRTIGNFWVDLSARRCGSCSRIAFVFAIVLLALRRDPEHARLHHRAHRRRRDPADPRRPGRRARSRSSSSAPTVAASST